MSYFDECIKCGQHFTYYYDRLLLIGDFNISFKQLQEYITINYETHIMCADCFKSHILKQRGAINGKK